MRWPVVLDTNIYVGAALGRVDEWNSIVLAWKKGRIFSSEYIWRETKTILQTKADLDPSTVSEYMGMFRAIAKPVGPLRVLQTDCSDSNDLPILGTAMAARAKYLVSLDGDLTSIGYYKGIAIVPCLTFLGIPAVEELFVD